MKVDRRLLGVRKPGSIFAQTKPGSSRNLFYLLSRAPDTDAVVFAHDVNRTAVLPFQTHMGQYLSSAGSSYCHQVNEGIRYKGQT